MRTLKYILLFSCSVPAIMFFGCFVPAFSQVPGCKDPAASNYNPSATVADTSCTYNATFYTPPVKVAPINNLLVETSGLQWAGNSLWSFNDGGGAAAIYRIDTASDAILQTVNLGGTTNQDWEAIAFDGTCFYVGDFGNNANGARTDLKIYKFPISAIPAYTTDPVTTISSAQIEVINFTYSDQVPVVASGLNNTKFDCEAMIVDGGRLHLFSKNWVDATTTHYVINDVAAGTYIATPMETLATNYLVTAADNVPGQNIIALLGYQNSGPGNHYLHLLSDFSGGLYFNGNKRLINLPDATVMGQAEAITFRNSTFGYISNEIFTRTVGPFTLTVEQKLRSFTITNFVPVYVLPLNLIKFSASNTNGLHKLNWNFAAPVQGLKILSSSNRTDFTELQQYNTTREGFFNNRPSATITCYKLAWQRANGAYEYSNTVCLDNEEKKGLRNVVFHKNGELSFILNGNESDEYSFRLLTVDGRVIAQTGHSFVTPGTNTIRFLQNLRRNNLVFLQAIGNKNQMAVLLKTED